MENYAKTADLPTFTKKKLKDVLSGLRQFLATERSLNMTKNAFYFN